ncbi:NAD(P)-dependent malic enzyme [Clostridium thermobutyricum]|uniref:NAD-dependent malic enzyme n=1 Tax=Clostridium thermobutyricum DSM 4928 TaxID=1121339 RepID=A0A1V4STY1_9CLOT|nr:NADP-dependent malic enzyme [Clostridium thermobutyricum]OPX47325.1 NAD-dependent malic enzyme [Clostridium thermobutyricum DSM 4928]
MDVKQESLRLHKEKMGEIEITGKFNVENKEDLSIVYTPGVAAPCLEIAADKEKVYDYTLKGRTIAVITNGTAVLGLGDIGPEGGLPVVEAKALLHKEFAGVDAFPIALNENDPDKIVEICKSIAPGFGGIHLEDIKAPECFKIEERLIKELDIPVYHDDQHGTSIAVLAGLLNSLKIVDKKIEDIKILINGAGASGIAIAKLLIAAGAKNIVLADINGALVAGDNSLNEPQKEIAAMTNKEREVGKLEEIIKNKDVFIGVSVGNIVTKEMIQTMNKDSIIFALANPIPEILPSEAKKGGARIVSTGRGDFKNQVNNLLVFPGIFKGALKGRVTNITDEMKINAAKGIASLISSKDLNEDNIIPSVFNKEVVDVVANSLLK